MGPHKLLPLAAAFLFAVPLVRAQVFVVGEKTAEADVNTEFHPTHVPISDQGLTERGHLDLVRNLVSEQGFAHRELPAASGLNLVANGSMSPSGEAYKQMLYEKGQAAAPGDRVEISSLKFQGDRIVIDFNGGPYSKHRFLSHVSIEDMPLAYEGPIATGFRITLIFEGGLPEISAAEVKSLLEPIIDFKARSAAEAFTNTLAPKVRDAVAAHKILVGMNRRTVMAALGEPATKHREHSAGDTSVLEEWIYGQPPQPTQFVRFKDGKVVRLEIAAIGKPIEVHDKNEVDDATDPALMARTITNGDNATQSETHARPAPTLMKPGEKSENPNTEGKVRMPVGSPSQTLPKSQPPVTQPTPSDTPKQFASSL